MSFVDIDPKLLIEIEAEMPSKRLTAEIYESELQGIIDSGKRGVKVDLDDGVFATMSASTVEAGLKRAAKELKVQTLRFVTNEEDGANDLFVVNLAVAKA